jgi:PST family polysaccharide transporter
MDARWLKWLPSPLRRRIAGRYNLQAILGNSGWLFVNNILRMGVGLVVSVWVARYLGPEQYGTLNYAIAFVALFSVCANLGLDSIVIRDIARDSACSEESLGTALALKLAGAFVTLLLSVAAIAVLRPQDYLSLVIVTIIASGTFFQAFDTIDFWYQSQVRSKFAVYARNPAFLAISLVKVLLIVLEAPLVAFAWAGLGEIALGACGLVLVYRGTGGRLSAWRFSWSRAVGLLRESWPLFLSGAFVLLYIKIDQIMIGQMLGDERLGVYSAAVRLTEVWYFIPVAITSSVFPAIVSAKKTGEAKYYDSLEQLYLLMVWLALGVAIPITVFAEPIVELVFGPEYRDGATVLAIQCWSGLFIFAGLVSNHWYLLENLSHYTLYRHLLGAGMNIAINLVLIPRYGIDGAAIATLITQFITSYMFDLLNRPTKILFRIKSRYFFLFLPITIRHLMGATAGGKGR